MVDGICCKPVEHVFRLGNGGGIVYKELTASSKLTVNEASEQYPDNFILMRMDSLNISDPTGLVLYVGDNGDELFDLQVQAGIPNGLVVDGMNRQQSLGGIFVGS
jgi:hypothetical protein